MFPCRWFETEVSLKLQLVVPSVCVCCEDKGLVVVSGYVTALHGGVGWTRSDESLQAADGVNMRKPRPLSDRQQ